MVKNKKVALVSLLGTESLTNQQNGFTVFNDLENLGMHYVAAIALQRDHECRIFHPYQRKNSSEEAITDAIIQYKPEIIGFSALTNTFPRASQMATEIKRNLPHSKVVFGSDHVGAYPSALLNNPAINIGVMGEGEDTFREILEEKPLDTIEGIAYVDGKDLKITTKRKRRKDRTELPFAFRDAEILSRSKVGAMMYPSLAKQTGTASFLFQFGCPLGCTYCTATTLYNSALTRSTPKHVVEEMLEVKNRFKVNTAMFTDLTFNLNTRESESLCAKINEAKTGIHWYAMIRPTSPSNQPLVKDSLLEHMAGAGCSKIGFGVESWEPNATRDFHRPTNLEEDYRILRKIDTLGIISKVFLMIGHPSETTKYYNDVIRTLKELAPDEVRVSFLTPFPGTELWKTMKNDLLTEDYSLYTTFHPVLKMNCISSEQLITERKRILQEYYQSSEFYKHVNLKTRQFPFLQESYTEFIGHLRNQKII